jgi:glucose-6-phosphate isomerase
VTSQNNVTFEFGLGVHPLVKGGVPERNLLEAQEKAGEAVEAVLAAVENNQLGFWTLPDDEEMCRQCTATGQRLRKEFQAMVVLGIGGSSLGGRMLRESLAPDAPLHFWDNVDPDALRRGLDGIDLEQTCFNVISKSGGTVETAAQFVIVRDLLLRRFGEDGYRKRMVVTTDPAKGVMKDLVDQDGLTHLPVPQNVGGRFSVLSSVGLMPAAFAGMPIEELMAGARAMRTRAENKEITSNPALMAALIHTEAMALGRRIHVMMPYCNALREFGDWYSQLWAESLGKANGRNGSLINVGPTPVVALGATDQHSQTQLYMEGPADKLITFIQVGCDSAARIPFPKDLPDAYSYFQNRDVAGLLDAELDGTRFALARSGHPSILVRVTELSAHALGQLIFFYEAKTAFAGEFLDIDAFDQPGVEMGKKIAFGLMGRPEFQDDLQGLNIYRETDDRWRYN